ncbi:ectonucleoside triphosphate diphosphohydrolase 5 isoform X5 [Ornithorhynchus anatinus]|uniref:ectonucleoside triphosphate diphosphohydrolase 5 isoform X5 n=1 Tax=Ornithorhynchus anatinus TaxID=9258 RepID=UPI0019D427F4|nr:ectonucleoside triphosphate diphosphohydrolase 5 isoform X5 [Ornithorhynchus anatinus]
MTPGPPAALALLAACLLCCAARRREPPTWFEGVFPSSACPVAAATLYGVMFDAGSTGTRIHVYTFVRRRPEQPPELEGEIFDSVKPGLSAFADRPKQGAETVRELLEVAKESVPAGSWKRTPVVLKATAGLRLLPDHKARALLSEVREVLEKSPFLVPEDGVSIMDGSYEGILAWVTVNFLTGQLRGQNPQTVGTLDLGGASTQITFRPRLQGTLDQTPSDHLTSFEMFNSTYELYTHSYLGFGLKAARLAILGALDAEGASGRTFRSSCLPRRLEAEWHFAGVRYRYGGSPEDEDKGGTLQVRDFERKAREACERSGPPRSGSPFLCMDLSYIAALLKEGFGFEDTTVLQLTKKVNDVETGWALGATFHLLQSLGLSR